MAGAEPPMHSVIVVGAGIAGLAAAKELLPQFPDLLIVEASHRRGGRVLQEAGVLPWPVEIGPEFIHGASSALQDTLMEMGCKLTEHEWPDHWYFRDERRLKHASVKDADIEAVMDTFEAVGRQAYPAQDLSVEQWLHEGGASNRMIDIADACFANDFGCSISQLGMRETILENRSWDAGETYLVLDRSLSGLVEHVGRSTSANTLLDWPVTRIEYSSSGAVLSSLRGRKLRCRRVIITVPVTVLQREDILFRPPLPQYKRAAIQRVKMSNAIKVILVLDRPIWPEHFFDVVCPGSFIPEFWVTRYPAAAGYSGADLCGITGFVCGKPAEEMSGMRESSIVRATLAQLDEMFGCGPPSARDRYPATNAFVRAHVADWSKQPFIRGAYTYPSLGAEIGDRDALARPVDNTLFFAGEATHPAVNPCLQAAWETGLSAANLVKEAASPLSRM